MGPEDAETCDNTFALAGLQVEQRKSDKGRIHHNTLVASTTRRDLNKLQEPRGGELTLSEVSVLIPQRRKHLY